MYFGFTNEEIEFFSLHQYVDIIDYDRVVDAIDKAKETMPTDDMKCLQKSFEKNLMEANLVEENIMMDLDDYVKEVFENTSHNIFNVKIENDIIRLFI